MVHSKQIYPSFLVSCCRTSLYIGVFIFLFCSQGAHCLHCHSGSFIFLMLLYTSANFRFISSLFVLSLILFDQRAIFSSLIFLIAFNHHLNCLYRWIVLFVIIISLPIVFASPADLNLVRDTSTPFNPYNRGPITFTFYRSHIILVSSQPCQ